MRDKHRAGGGAYLLCHKAVNNVLGQIGVLVDLQRQTAWLQQKRCCNVATEGRARRLLFFFSLSHRLHFKGKQHVLQVRWHLVLGCPGSVLDGSEHQAAVVTVNNTHGWTMCHSQTTLTNSWLGTMTVVWWVSTLTLTTSPSLVRYSSSLSGSKAKETHDKAAVEKKMLHFYFFFNSSNFLAAHFHTQH